MSKETNVKENAQTKLDASQRAMIDIAKFRETLKDKTEEELLKMEQDIIKLSDKHAVVCQHYQIAVHIRSVESLHYPKKSAKMTK